MASDTLPEGMRLDPRSGQRGGQYVLIICAECGKEFRVPMWQIAWYRKNNKPLPRFCSKPCVKKSWQKRGVR